MAKGSKKTPVKKKAAPVAAAPASKEKSKFETELISAIAKSSNIDEDEAEAWLRKHTMGKTIITTYKKVHG